MRDFVEMAFISVLFLAVLFTSACSTPAEVPSQTARHIRQIELRGPVHPAK